MATPPVVPATDTVARRRPRWAVPVTAIRGKQAALEGDGQGLSAGRPPRLRAALPHVAPIV